MQTELTQFFRPQQIVYAASAPGRLDVMGGIADYSGSLVLQKTIEERAFAWVALREDGIVRVRSLDIEFLGMRGEIQVDLQDLLDASSEVDYEIARTKLARIKEGEWAAYAIGCVLVLMKEKGVASTGADIFLQSEIPIGKGVSSSAAIEVAVMAGLAKAYRLELGKEELPLLAQRVENRIVGAPCGIMDQMVSYLGRENRLLPILCQPVHAFRPIEIPEEIQFVGIDCGVRHAVSGASYSDVRTAAFMGYSIIAQKEGLSIDALRQAKETGKTSDLPFFGYLANIDLSLFETRFWPLLPERITGREFLEQYGDIIDSATAVDPAKEYAVNVCAAHPVFENHRVNTFAHLLETLSTQEHAPSELQQMYRLMGEAMFESHSSYSACGLGCSQADELVRAVCDADPQQGVYGAKITGGGSGGTVCVLTVGETGYQTVVKIAQRHAKRHDIEPVLFVGSSPGTCWTDVKPVSLS